MDDFYRIKRLPPYVLAGVTDLKVKARARGEDIIDLGMGNPDTHTPAHRRQARRGLEEPYPPLLGLARYPLPPRRDRGMVPRPLLGVELDPETETIATIGSKEGLADLMSASSSSRGTRRSSRTS